MWTSSKPVAIGYRWYRADAHNENIIVEIFEDDGLYVVPVGDRVVESSSINDWNGEWWDKPIETPN